MILSSPPPQFGQCCNELIYKVRRGLRHAPDPDYG